jgi:hypothetical protein
MQAWAECAWLLWIWHSREGFENPVAFPSALECSKGIANAHLPLKDLRGTRAVEAMDSPYKGRITVYSDAGKNVMSLESHCLPDAIDPRGPKRK